MPMLQELIAADQGSGYSAKVPLAERFWRQVRKAPGNACWLWTGALKGFGYGGIMVGSRGCRRIVPAHQIAMYLDGRPLPEGMVTRHTCHTPACVRPSHLVIGTQAQNNADKVPVGRSTYGEKNPAHKLTEIEVLEIRTSGVTVAALASRFGVSPDAVYQARRGYTWRHLPGLTTPAPAVSR